MADETKTAAYMAWTTFMGALDALAGNVHNRIDRTVFPGQSGGVQSQILSGFKFLGLIDEDGNPQPALHAVAVRDEDARKAALRRIIEDKYADLFALDLMKTTPALFAERISSAYNVTGDTREKATRFFLNAVAYLGIPVSQLLAKDKPKTTSNGGQATRRRRVSRAPRQEASQPSAPLPPASGTARTIALNSGGTLTITASLDLFSLNPADRSFVFGLIDKLDEYEKGTAGK